MTSIVSICNQALGWLGADLITALTDDNVGAKLCNANYSDLRDSVLEEKNWSFALRRFQLAKDGAAPAFGYTNRFLIPGDVLRVVLATGNASNERPGLTDFLVEDGYILTDETDIVYMKAVCQVTDVSKFTAGFTQAFAARMAVDFAVPLTHSKTIMKDMMELYLFKLSIASANDGRQGKAEKTRSNALQNARYGSSIIGPTV